ncbi:hypothetical protein MLD38_013022 [Melastoma candidum]|uniref:Uncharacterized protein n=1 Tax=Melastoma candidum TaxID=119954 RepID=A0ACB9R9C8_9MYRT|nr:hypothetical protein MLD38_013022 [Melastoma candidum]
MAAAAAIPGRSLFFPPPSTSGSPSIWSPGRTRIGALPLPRRWSNLHRSSFLGASYRNFSPSRRGTSFLLFSGSLEEDATSPKLGEDTDRFRNLSELISVYKQAYISGDEEVVSKIEASICSIDVRSKQLSEKVASLPTELTSLKQKYIRLQADFDNFRKRSEKESLTVRTDAQRDIIESFLAVVDNFEKAKQYIKPETEKEKKIDASYQGIYKQFVEVMRSLKVSVIAPTVGKPFNPSLHEATGREESQEYKEGIVIRELRRGFLLGDKILRPAKVKVSAGPGPKKAEKISKGSPGQATASVGME